MNFATLLSGTGFSGLLRLYSLLLGLAVSIYLARNLGPEDYGRYAFVLTLVLVAALPVISGLPGLLVRELARARQRADNAAASGLMRFAGILILLGAVFVAAASALALWLAPALVDRLSVSPVLVLAIVPFVALVSVQRAAVNGLGHTFASQWPELVVRPMVLMAMLLLISLASAVDLGSAVLALFVSYLAAVLLGTALLRYIAGVQLRRVAAVVLWRQWLRSLPALGVYVGAQFLLSQVDILMVGTLGNAEQTGLYKVAATGAFQMMLFASIVNQYLAPRISVAHATADHRLAGRLVRYGVGLLGVASMAFGLVILVWGEDIVRFVVGEAYVGALPALYLLTGSYFCYSVTAPIGTYFSMTGREKLLATLALGAIAANVVLNWLLIPRYGLMGAAAATSAVMILWRACLVIVYCVSAPAVGQRTSPGNETST